jgi:hypothetical protein
MGLFMMAYFQFCARLGPLGCLLAPITLPLTLLLSLVARALHLLGIHTYSSPMGNGVFLCMLCHQRNRIDS